VGNTVDRALSVAVPVDAAIAGIPGAYRAEALAAGAHSARVITLAHRGEILGRVTVLADATAASEPADTELADDLARRAAIALENARLHDRARRALQARDDTLGVVAHDLYNPVNAVRMLAGAMLRADRPSPLPGDVVEQVTVVRSAAEQMDSLIHDLLDVSRAEAGRLTVDPQPIPTAALLEDALRTLVPLAQDKEVALRTAFANPLPDVCVDPERVAQVVSNVVGNAIKFTPRGAAITISAAAAADHVLVSVKDTGPGISAEHLPHVFDRYWQSSRRNRGAGLGLPIAKAIIEAHHGRIWAESTEGRGATFHFTLPTRPPADLANGGGSP
jgi:signal transduction histidine kinase